MAIPSKVSNYLKKLKIKYKPVRHKKVYTAYDAAATMKAKLGEIAKALHIIADKKHYLVVLPASYRLDVTKLKKLLRAKKLEIAKEKLMTKVFKLKKGPVVPFVGFYKDVEVLIDRALSRAKRVIVSAGTFEDSLEMKFKDFVKAAGGKMSVFGKKK